MCEHRRRKHHKTIEIVLRPGQKLIVKAKGKKRHHRRHCC